MLRWWHFREEERKRGSNNYNNTVHITAVLRDISQYSILVLRGTIVNRTKYC